MVATSEVGAVPFILQSTQILRKKVETIYTYPALFHNRFDGNTTHKAELEVCLICVQDFCKVDFRNTSEETESRNLLSTLHLILPFPSIDRLVSNFFKCFCKTGITNNNKSCGLDCLANPHSLPPRPLIGEVHIK